MLPVSRRALLKHSLNPSVMIRIAEPHSGDISRQQYELQHQVQLWSDTKTKRRAAWKSDPVPKMRPNAENKTQDTTC